MLYQAINIITSPKAKLATLLLLVLLVAIEGDLA